MLAAVLALAVTAARASSACEVLALDTSTPINTVAPYFASWNIDSSRDRLFFDVNWTAPELVYLLSQIGGARIRFGGTGNDVLYYGLGDAPPCGPTKDKVYECLNETTWNALAAIAVAADSPLVFGLNIHPAGGSSPPKGPWDGTNARALLTLAHARGQRLSCLELGNEQNTIMTAAEQAAAFVVLSGVLDDVYGAGSPARPTLVGPDTHSFRDAGSSIAVVLKYLQDFARGAAGVLHAITHHECEGAGASGRGAARAVVLSPHTPPPDRH